MSMPITSAPVLPVAESSGRTTTRAMASRMVNSMRGLDTGGYWGG
jgi:hypothetical protein